MAISRAAFETGLHLVTTALICGSLVQETHGHWWGGVIALALLCVLACAADWCAAGELRPLRYPTREAESSGVGAGALALPWVFGGLLAAAGGARALTRPAFWAAVASAALQLCFLCRPALRARRGGSKALSLGFSSGALSLAAAAVLAAGQPAGTAAALATALLGCAALHATLVYLPQTFTLGEGMVVSQALALVTSYALRTAQSCGLLHSRFARWGCSAASPFQAFVACLVVGSVALAAVVSGLLVCPSGRKGRASLGQEQAQDGTAGSEASGGAVGFRSNGHAGGGSSVHRRGRHPAEQLPPARRPDANGRGAAGSIGRPRGWRLAAALLVLVAGALAVIKPALWSLAFATSTPRRAGVLAYWVALLASSLPAMQRLAASNRVSNIIVRKGYHLLAVGLFLPAAALEPALLGVSLAIAFALLAAVELARAVNAPFVGRRINDFMTSFVDSRDSGAIFVTHFTLLLGMAAPLWLSDALYLPAGGGTRGDRNGGAAAGEAPPLWPAGMAGIVILGLGDTAASVVGRLCGRHPICAGSKKTWEGSAGSLGATLLGWWLLAGCGLGAGSGQGSSASKGMIGGAGGVFGMPWAAVAAASVLSSLLESVTTQLDNLFVPLHYFALLCCGVALSRAPWPVGQ